MLRAVRVSDTVSRLLATNDELSVDIMIM